MTHIYKVLKTLLLVVLLTACGKTAFDVPSSYEERATQADIYPDYKDITIPVNIAPLNFMTEGTEGLVVTLQGSKGEALTASGIDRIDMDTTQWRSLLQANAGGKINVTVYTMEGGKWFRHAPHHLDVAEAIDPYLSYRLIEPGYELYRQLGIYQRCLENFTQTPIYENNRSYSQADNHCINCHNFRNYDAGRMLFHVRANHGGTVLICLLYTSPSPRDS